MSHLSREEVIELAKKVAGVEGMKSIFVIYPGSKITDDELIKVEISEPSLGGINDESQ